MSTSIPKLVIFACGAIVLALSAGCAAPYPELPFGNASSGSSGTNLASLLSNEGSAIKVADIPTTVSTGTTTGTTTGATGSSTTSTSTDASWLTSVTNPVSSTPSYSNLLSYLYPGPVIQLYTLLAAYNPDFSQPGPQFWAEMLFYGRPLLSASANGVENSFINSPYVQSLASGAGGNVNYVLDANADCITVFGNVFGTSATVNGNSLPTWAQTIYSQIQSGQTEANVLQNTFYEFEQAATQTTGTSGVYYTYPIVQLYRGYLNQAPAQSTIQTQIQSMANGTGWADIRNAILAQDTSIGGNSAVNIITVFRLVLGCLPTSSALQYWVSTLGDTTQINSQGYYNTGLQQLAQVLLNAQINGAGTNTNIACQND